VSSPPPGSIRALLSDRWEDIEQSVSTWELHPEETLRPETFTRESRRALVLSSLGAAGSIGSAGQRLELHDVLGMGGMGVVHRGTQASLGREVAIKAVRPDRRTDDSTVKLLQEAWIAGTLGHPNIVPVYDIGLGADGEPLIVQQRVEGRPWGELMDDAEAVEQAFHDDDLLEWNLRVLMHVCNAVRFAHSRGVLHLDIKPGNVMIGGFGEVFLLDWGLAMALSGDALGRLPLASENEDVLGTPAFMAPEMLSQGDAPLSQRTDVYLLGATLYRICAGHPPHRGPTPLATMYAAAMKSPPPLTTVPEELASVCARAMSPEPADRYPNADALRVAIQDFLQHRGAVRLADGVGEPRRPAHTEQLQPGCGLDEVRALFSAARFGYEQARALWSETPGIAGALQDLHLGMARWELDQDRPQAASALLAQIDSPPLDLVAEVEAQLDALRNLGARVEKLQAYRDQQDIKVGMRTRALISGTLGLCFTLVPIYRALSPAKDSLDWTNTIAVPAALLALFSVLSFIARDTMLRSAINRRTIATVFVVLLGQSALSIACQSMGLAPDATAPLLLVLWATASAMYAALVDRRLLPTTLAYITAMFCAVTWPQWQWWATTVAHACFTINVVTMWWPSASNLARPDLAAAASVPGTDAAKPQA